VAPFKALQRAISPLEAIVEIPVFAARSVSDVPQVAKSVDEWFDNLQATASSMIAAAKLKEYEERATDAVGQQQAWADAAVELFDVIMAKNSQEIDWASDEQKFDESRVGDMEKPRKKRKKVVM